MITLRLNKAFSSMRFGLELFMVVAIKAAFIMVIWKLFFTHPIEDNLTVNSYQEHFFGKAHSSHSSAKPRHTSPADKP